MPAPHALYSKMLAERIASRNVLVLFCLFISKPNYAHFYSTKEHAVCTRVSHLLFIFISFCIRCVPPYLSFVRHSH